MITELDKRRALLCWTEAIREKLNGEAPDSMSFEDIAKQYAGPTMPAEALELVGTWFNWDEVLAGLP